MTIEQERTVSRRTRMNASPRARRAMLRLGIDPKLIRGSGPNGRIVEADLVQANQPPGVQARSMGVAETSTMRRIIAQRTSQSFATVPHFYLRAELDATALLKLREQLIEKIEKETGVRLTLTDLLTRALALALSDFPPANRIWQNDSLLTLPAVNIGLVVALEDGLMIPVIRQADQLELAALAKRRAELATAAHAGKLTAEPTPAAASSLSNLGKSRVDEFTAIIPPGQSSILAAGRVTPRPFVVAETLTVRPTLKLCLSVDHRVLDGTPAAAFFGRIIEFLENPERMR